MTFALSSLLAGIALLVLLGAACICVAVPHQRQRKKLTPEERKAEDEEMGRESQYW